MGGVDVEALHYTGSNREQELYMLAANGTHIKPQPHLPQAFMKKIHIIEAVQNSSLSSPFPSFSPTRNPSWFYFLLGFLGRLVRLTSGFS